MIIKVCKFDCGCIGIPLEEYNSGGRCMALILESCEGLDLTIQGVYYNTDEPMEMDIDGLRLLLKDLRKKITPNEELEAELRELKDALKTLRRFC